MKILAPLSRVEETEEIIKAGGNELYAGVFSKEWSKKIIPSSLTLNGRPFPSANLKTFEELRLCVKKAHEYSVPLFLTMNVHYPEAEFPLVLKELEEAIACEVDGLIVSDIGLMLKLKEYKIPLHVSTIGNTFNSYTVKFYTHLGASRITIPRDINIRELSSLINDNNKMQFDVFMLGVRCASTEGLCNFYHDAINFKSNLGGLLFRKFLKSKVINQETTKKNLYSKLRSYLEYCSLSCICALNYKYQIYNGKDKAKIRKHLKYLNIRFNYSIPCGICFLYQLNKFKNISSFKIGGRQHPTHIKIQNVIFLRNVLNLFDNHLSQKEFETTAKTLFFKNYRSPCNKLYCYYPI